jgi:hypothetical protein
MSNFISIFIEEHGQAPAFNIFESCEQVAKRFVQLKSKVLKRIPFEFSSSDQPESNDKSKVFQFKELS